MAEHQHLSACCMAENQNPSDLRYNVDSHQTTKLRIQRMFVNTYIRSDSGGKSTNIRIDENRISIQPEV